jgi:O-antigen ligase
LHVIFGVGAVAHPGARLRLVLSAATWSGIAFVVASIEAVALFLDVKLGIAVAMAFIAATVLLGRPSFLLPLALSTVFVENLTLNGQAVTRLVAPAILLVAVVEIMRGTGRLRLGAPAVWAAAYSLWAISSLLWTESFEGTQFLLQSLAIALVFTLAFAALLNTERDLRALLYVFAVVPALVGSLSMFAFAGWIEIPALELTQAGRAQGLVGDPDFFAGMQLVAAPLVLVLASETQSRRGRLLLYVCLLAIIASALTSLSRGAFIATAVLTILFLASDPERIFRSRREKALALTVIAVGMMVFFSRPFVRDEVVGRAQTIYAPKDKEDKTGSGRTNLWKAAARTAAENPVLGVGFGSFKYISEDLILHTPGIDLEVYGGRQEGDNFVAHNTYVGTAAELGFTGLALYVGLFVTTMVTLRRISTRAAAAGAAFVGRVAHALVLGLAAWAFSSIFLSAETTRILWIIVGITLALPKLIPDASPKRST